MSSDVTVTTRGAAWIAHVARILALLSAHDERVRRNAQIARGMATRKGADCCGDEAAAGRQARHIVLASRVKDDLSGTSYHPEPLQFAYWRVDSPYFPIIELLEVEGRTVPELAPQSLHALDIAFGPGADVLVLPVKAEGACGPDRAGRREFSRRYVARHVWELCGRQHTVRLSVPNFEESEGEGAFAFRGASVFDSDSLLRERLVPVWQGNGTAPRWARLNVHELSSRELAQLQI